MPPLDSLPHLLRLVDDPSEPVRTAVAGALAAYGPGLDLQLRSLHPPPTEDHLAQIADLLADHQRRWILENWSSWTLLTEPRLQLERAFALLAKFQCGPAYPLELEGLLDQLAEEFRGRPTESSPRSLAHYLFHVCPFRGARNPHEDPRAHNLVHCILERRGSALSLACIFMLVGWRLGFDIEGLAVPGHFFTRVRHGQAVHVIDCFGGGRMVSSVEFASLDRNLSSALSRGLERPASAPSMVARALGHLHRAYLRQGREADALLMLDLLHHPWFPPWDASLEMA